MCGRSQVDRPNPPAQARAADAPLTVEEVCVVLKISRSTYYDWRAKGTGPKSFRLPNGSIRIKLTDLVRQPKIAIID
jgi:predicted DNA-binding transcriptional regulator AlpA